MESASPPDNPLCRLLEDLCLTAWPAVKTIHDDGWVLRFAQGHTGRANAVTCLAPGDLAVVDKVDRAEAAYAREGLPTRFRLTPLAPSALIAELDRRDYARREESLVQVAGIPAKSGLAVGAAVEDTMLRWQVHSAPDTRWLAGYEAALPVPKRERPVMRRLLGAIAPPAFYLGAWADGRFAAGALGVVDRGWLGLYKVLVAPAYRGRGLAHQVTGRLLALGAQAGASRAYLQVGAVNAPALATYARSGFRTVYAYHYRQAP